MELTVTQANLAKALNITSRIANAKTSKMPILNNIVLEASKGGLTIKSTNLEIAVVEQVGAKVTKPGQVAIPAKVVTEFVNNLPTDVVNLKLVGTRLVIESQGFKSTINGVATDEFPELPTIDESTAVHYVLSDDDFKQAVTQVLTSVSTDQARMTFTGVLWHTVDGQLYLASTDSYRLGQRRLIQSKSDLTAIVPAQALHEALRAMDESTKEVDVLFSDTQVRFRIGKTEVISQLIEGIFPDYQQLFPKSSETKVVLDRDDFIKVSKIAGLFAIQSASGVKIIADNDRQILAVESIASEVGENISEIPAKITGGGSVVLNPRFLLDVLNVIHHDEIEFSFSGKLQACLIEAKVENPDFRHVIMPLKS